jgi:hypothetical protein
MLAVQYANARPDLLVTAIDPGLTATEFTDYTGQTIEEGTEAIVTAIPDNTEAASSIATAPHPGDEE